MPRMMMILILVLMSGGCSSNTPPEPARTLTEAQRDSVLGQSDVPGASAVGRAQGVSGIEAKHAAGVNAMVDSLPR